MPTEHDPAAPAPLRDRFSWVEFAVIMALIALGAGVAIAFGLGAFDSAAITAFFVGLVAAGVTYHFLGGIPVAALNTPAIRLGGSGALLVATMLLIRPPLAAERDKRDTVEKAVADATRPLNARIANQKVEIDRLRGGAPRPTVQPSGSGPVSDAEILSRIRSLVPEDEFAKKLRSMQRDRAGPWETTQRQVRVEINFINFQQRGETTEPRVFLACEQLDLRRRTVRFRMTDELLNPDNAVVSAVYDGRMGTDQCEGEEANRIQLGCASARKLVPAKLERCAADGTPLWKEGVPGGGRYEAMAEVEARDE